VYGVPNLYLMGGGVFPTVSWANPTLTVMALTYRLADHLRRELSSGTVQPSTRRQSTGTEAR
jgi:choline dehydrogenase-like flavoprotein